MIVNRGAMIKSEVLSWPVTLVILVLAFGSLIAAGLPLMLTLVGLVIADPGAMLYERMGSYAAVAERTGLDPRTSRKYVLSAKSG